MNETSLGARSLLVEEPDRMKTSGQRKATEEVTVEFADSDADRGMSSATAAEGRAISSRSASLRI